MSFSLIEIIRQRYLDTIQSVKPSNGRWKILVLDKHSQSLIHGVLKTFEILELGVQQIDLIENNRNPTPNLDVIYMLAPIAKNIDRIIADFCPHGSTGKKAPPEGFNKYAGAHMYFVDALDDQLVNRLTHSPAAPYLRQLIELFTNIGPEEPQVDTLPPPNPRSFLTLYAPPPIRSAEQAFDIWEEETCCTSTSLINLFATLGEKPYIRYYQPPSPPLGLAGLVKEHSCKRLAFCLATDMCNDLLEIANGNKYVYSFKDHSGEIEEKEVILGEEDKVWVEVRHMHMKDALDKLMKDFKAHATEHGHLTNGTSLNDIKDMLASLPHLKESKEKLSLHLSMAETCMELFEKRQLAAIASVEQCCSTGMTAEGRTPKSIVEEMVPLLDDRTLSTSDKLRIVALYVLYRDGVPDEDRRRLYQHAKLALHEMDAVNNLIHIGANVTKDSGKKKKQLFKQSLDENAYDISRFQPFVKLMLEEALSNKLDLNLFPYMGETPTVSSAKTGAASLATNGGGPASLRSAKPSWQRPKSKTVIENRQRVMVFVDGGLTHSEIRAAYEVSEAHTKDIVIGSTHIHTPKKYIADLINIDKGGAS